MFIFFVIVTCLSALQFGDVMNLVRKGVDTSTITHMMKNYYSIEHALRQSAANGDLEFLLKLSAYGFLASEYDGVKEAVENNQTTVALFFLNDTTYAISKWVCWCAEYAAMNNNLRILKALVDRAKLQQTDLEFETCFMRAVDMAVTYNRFEVLEYLENESVDMRKSRWVVSSLVWKVADNNSDSVYFLISKGVRVDNRALDIAMKHDYVEMVKYLMDRVKFDEDFVYTMVVKYSHKTEMMNILQQYGFNEEHLHCRVLSPEEQHKILMNALDQHPVSNENYRFDQEQN